MDLRVPQSVSLTPGSVVAWLRHVTAVTERDNAESVKTASCVLFTREPFAHLLSGSDCVHSLGKLHGFLLIAIWLCGGAGRTRLSLHNGVDCHGLFPLPHHGCLFLAGRSRKHALHSGCNFVLWASVRHGAFVRWPSLPKRKGQNTVARKPCEGNDSDNVRSRSSNGACTNMSTSTNTCISTGRTRT